MRILPQDQAVLDYVARAEAAMVDRAVAWANQPSGSHHPEGLNAMLAMLEAAVAALPADARRVATAPMTSVSDQGDATTQALPDALRLSVRPEAPIQVALTGHYDTVYPAHDPFRTVTRRGDGALNGPGIADMKGGISVMLAALEAFETHPERERLGWTLLLSPDEEIGSPASAPLLAQLGAEAHVGLTYEPSLPDDSFAGARKGSANWHLAVQGRSAHAGRAFEEGRNAVAAAAQIAGALHALNGRHEGVTLNVARISGGAAMNVVPDHAVVRFNARVPDADAARWIEAAVADIASAPPFEGIALHLHGGFTRPPRPMDAAQTALFKAVRDTGALLGQTIRWSPSGGVCEGNNLYAAGLPCIDTLGVRGGAIHSRDEFAWPDSFVERAQLSALILCRLASGDIDGPGLKRLRAEGGAC